MVLSSPRAGGPWEWTCLALRPRHAPQVRRPRACAPGGHDYECVRPTHAGGGSALTLSAAAPRRASRPAALAPQCLNPTREHRHDVGAEGAATDHAQEAHPRRRCVTWSVLTPVTDTACARRCAWPDAFMVTSNSMRTVRVTAVRFTVRCRGSGECLGVGGGGGVD